MSRDNRLGACLCGGCDSCLSAQGWWRCADHGEWCHRCDECDRYCGDCDCEEIAALRSGCPEVACDAA